jgi:hypothetical protein
LSEKAATGAKDQKVLKALSDYWVGFLHDAAMLFCPVFSHSGIRIMQRTRTACFHPIKSKQSRN